ncbi:hypothetical protein V1477_006332 [Vespula maculifrons]|uniref:Uncharacterized protein n=1 Tax=Vespula maculifrons TaxID=7453 RepID=A0ABD2CK57_VESMC
MGVEGATSPLNDHGPVLLGTIVSEKKIVKEKFFFSLFPLNRYNSAPIGPIFGSYWSDLYAENMGVEGATSPLNDPGLVLLGAIVSEKKILKEKCFFLCSL